VNVSIRNNLISHTVFPHRNIHKYTWAPDVGGGAGGTYFRKEKCIQGFVAKSDGKRPLGKLRRKWEDNIKMGIQEIRWEEVADWINEAQDTDKWRTLLNEVMNFPVP
jgi:hypothetical protein